MADPSEASDLYRAEALAHYRKGTYRPGPPLQMPRWVRASSALLGALAATALVFSVAIPFPDSANGPVVVRPDPGGRLEFIAALPADIAMRLEVGTLLRFGEPPREVRIEAIDREPRTAAEAREAMGLAGWDGADRVVLVRGAANGPPGNGSATVQLGESTLLGGLLSARHGRESPKWASDPQR